MGCTYVSVEEVQALFRNRKVVDDAFFGTGREPITDGKGVHEALGRWPNLPEDMYERT